MMKYFKNDIFPWIKYALLILIFSSIGLFILYEGFKTISLNLLKKESIEVLNYSNSAVKYIHDTIYANTQQTFYNKDIQAIKNKTAPTLDEIFKAKIVLNQFKDRNLYIHSAYIFNKQTNNFYATSNIKSSKASSFFDQEVISIIDNLSNNTSLIYRFIQNPKTRGVIQTYTYIFYDSDNNYLIINFETNYIDSILSNLFLDMNLLILNEKLRVIGSSFKVDESEVELIEKAIITQTKKSGIFNLFNHNKKYIYIYSNFGNTKWSLIRKIDYANYFKELERMRFYIIMIFIISIFIILIITTLNLIKYYKPLKKVMFELNSSDIKSISTDFQHLLTTSKTVETGYLRHLKLEYLRSLLNRGPLDKTLLLSEFNTFEINFDLDKNIYLYRFSPYSYKLSEHLDTIDYNIALTRYNNSLIVFSDILIPINEIQIICDTFEVYCCISRSISWENDFRKVNSHLQETSSYIGFNSDIKILFEKDLVLKKTNSFELISIEQKIVTLINSENIEETKEVYLQYINSLSDYRLSSIIFSLKRLYLSILTPHKKVDEEILITLEDTISKDKNIILLNSIFFDLFELKLKLITEYKTSKNGILSNKIKDLINQNFKDLNLSCKSIADVLHFSSVYMGKVFKDENGYSIADYINQKRLLHSKFLLDNSDFPIKSITEECGFPNKQYFFALFKKYYKQTPSEYRRRNK